MTIRSGGDLLCRSDEHPVARSDGLPLRGKGDSGSARSSRLASTRDVPRNPRNGGIWMNLGVVPRCKASRSPRASGQRRCVAGTAPRAERFHDYVKQRSACGYAQHGGRGGQSEEYCVAEQESG